MTTMTPTTSSTTTTTTSAAAVRRVAAGALLAGAALVTAVPAHAAPVPEDPVASTQQSGIAVEDATRGGDGVTVGGVPAQVTAKLQAMERAAQDEQRASQTSPASVPDSDPSSVPLILLTLVGGGLVTGAAGFAAYRFRHHAPVGAATA